MFYKENMSHPILFDEEHGYLSEFTAGGTFADLTPRPHEDKGTRKFPVTFVPEVVIGPLPAASVHVEGVHILWEKRIGERLSCMNECMILFTPSLLIAWAFATHV